MRKFFIFLLLVFYFVCFGQQNIVDHTIKNYDKFYLLDDLASEFEVKSYKLNTKELYGIDKTVEMYNLLDGSTITLFSILPWKGENWIKVNFDAVKDKVVPKKNVYLSLRDDLEKSSKYLFKHGIVKKVGDDYYIPVVCLTERFLVRSYELPFIVDKTAINTLEKPVTIKEMKEYWDKTIPKYSFPLDIRKAGSTGIDYVTERFYLSKKCSIKTDTAYQFWSYVPWSVWDGYNKQRGIDRFVYIPNKGIVGGSYDFYFEFNLAQEGKISRDKLWDNIINEKVMLAEELK